MKSKYMIVFDNLSFLAVLIVLQALLNAAHAQDDPFPRPWDEVPPEPEEIIVYGERPDPFMITVYSVPEGFGVDFWVSQLVDILDQALAVLEDAEVDVAAACEQQQEGFRTSCLDLAHGAHSRCLQSGALFTGALARVNNFYARMVGIGVGMVTLDYCADVNRDATSACNDAADTFAWPEAPPHCS